MTSPSDSDSETVSVPPFVIAIDDREKDGHALTFPKDVATRVCHLPYGDYSLIGFEKRVAIERKSIPDLVGTLWSHSILSDGSKQQNSKRFAYELKRMRDDGVRRYVAVEGTEEALQRYFLQRARTVSRYGHAQRADFQKTLSFISSLEMRYGAIFKFCKDASDAAVKVYSSLYHAYRLFCGMSRDPIGDYRPPRDESTPKEKSGA